MGDYSHLDSVPQQEWIRLAAFLDGEGCIRVDELSATKISGASSRRYALQLYMNNTDPRLARWLKSSFGGTVTFKARPDNHPNWRPVWEWRVTARLASEILKRCKQYLLLKEEQAEVALAFRATFDEIKPNRYRAVPANVIEFREACRKQLKELKHRDFLAEGA